MNASRSSLGLPNEKLQFYHLTGEYQWPTEHLSASVDFDLFRETPIISESHLDPKVAEKIHGILDSESSYGGEPMRCFIPRHGISFSSESETVDYLICLECHIIHSWRDGVESSLFITKETVDSLGQIFPNRPDKTKLNQG
jgi:hypothetical protein